MNDDELDRLFARANPYGDATVRHLPTHGAESDLLEDIISTEAPESTPAPIGTVPGPAIPGPVILGHAVPGSAPAGPRRRRPGRRRAVVLLAAAATVAVALTGVFFPKGSSPIAPMSAYGAEFRAVTDATPRLVVDDPAWKIDDIPVFRANEGEIRFARGQQKLQVNWIPTGLYEGRLNQQRDPGVKWHRTPIEVLGQKGTVHQRGGSTDLTTLLPPKGPYFLEIRADVGSVAAYRNLVTKLKTVDTDTWLDAMPDTIVKQSDAPRVIDEMLADVPVRPGLDRTPFLKILVLDRYQFGAKLTEAVACGWFEQWAVAKKAGDKAKMKQATAVIQGSRNWKILQEMDAMGGRFPEGLWQDGDRMANNEDPRERNGMCR
jgi:hypothetical protein